MMSFESFTQEIVNVATKKLGDSYQVEIIKPLKNNGIIETQLCIKKEGHLLVPSIHLDHYYEPYTKTLDSRAINSIVDEILNQYYDNMEPEDRFKKLAVEVADYQNIKEKIVYKLINTAYNEELLMRVPSIPFMDLSIVFYLYLGETEKRIATAMIRNEHMEYWNITAEDLYQEAKKNSLEKLPVEFRDMMTIIREIMQENTFCEELPPLDTEDRPILYVLSNEKGINGAAAILYPGVAKWCAKKLKGDFLIYPSSVHEVILTPYNEDMSAEDMAEMIQMINATEVAKIDQLSDHAYRYCSLEDKIVNA